MTIFQKIGLIILRRRVLKMGGWKTKSGGIVVILTGLATAIQGFNDGDWDKVAVGIAMIGGGLTAIGLGAKLDKTKAAIEGTKPEPPLTQ